jgi:hypothetical protein
MRCSEVHEGSIFVATVSDEITGVSMVSIETGELGLRLGNIVEFVAKNASSMNALIQASLGYSLNKNVDAVIVVPTPAMSNQVLDGWLPFETGVMMVGLLSLSSLLQVLLDAHESEFKEYFAGKKVIFEVGDNSVEVGATPNGVKVGELDRQPGKDAITLTMSTEAFLEAVFDGLNPLGAYLTRKVKIRGMKNLTSLSKLLRMLKLANQIHVSNVDRV